MIEYRTDNMELAAYLLVRGHALLRREHNGRRVVFVFPPSAREEESSWFAGGTVTARAYATALHDVKTMIFTDGRKK